MRTSPRALLVAGIASSIILLLLAAPWQTQAAGVQAPFPTDPLSRAAQSVPLPTPTDPGAQHLLELVNQARWANGQTPPLKWNAALERAALGHSQNMAQDDFFTHQGTGEASPWDRIDAAGYGNWYVLAENIAAGYGRGEDVLQGWLASTQHRDNLMNPELHEAGIGWVFQAGDAYPGGTWGYGNYWTLDMGSRWDAYPLVIAGEAFSTTSRDVLIYVYGADWATELRLSNDGTDWSPWQAYKPMLTWQLPAVNGPKTVYGQLRNASGDVMQAEDEIVLAEPHAPVIRPAQATFILQQGQTVGQPQRYRVQVTDPSGTVHEWRASWDQDWLRLSATAGIAPSGVFLVLTDVAGQLGPGVYTATLSFWGGGMQAQVAVRLLVFPQVYTTYLPAVLDDIP